MQLVFMVFICHYCRLFFSNLMLIVAYNILVVPCHSLLFLSLFEVLSDFNMLLPAGGGN